MRSYYLNLAFILLVSGIPETASSEWPNPPLPDFYDRTPDRLGKQAEEYRIAWEEYNNNAETYRASLELYRIELENERSKLDQKVGINELTLEEYTQELDNYKRIIEKPELSQ